jgi:hypothetical protein
LEINYPTGWGNSARKPLVGDIANTRLYPEPGEKAWSGGEKKPMSKLRGK